MSTGFENTSTAVLLRIRNNLLNGLELVGQHVDAGTVDIIPPRKASAPRHGGDTILILLHGIEAELATRTESTT